MGLAMIRLSIAVVACPGALAYIYGLSLFDLPPVTTGKEQGHCQHL